MTVQIVNGIDVSRWQGDIDWSLVAKDSQDIKFAFVKATEGSTYVDPDFANNVKGAEAVGLQVGAYHFATFRNKDEAIVEAKFFVSSVAKFNLQKELVLDIESNRGNLSKSDLTDAVVAFLETVKSESKNDVAIYMNLNYFNNFVDMSKLSVYSLWIARYGASSGVSSADYWQNSDVGKVNGIKGYVDMDVEYVNESDVKASSKPSVPTTKPIPQEAFKANADETYVVKSGDILGRIALGFGVTVAELKAWNNLADVNAIKIGEKLIVKQPPKAKPVVQAKYYVVQKGDTLSAIATKEHTTVAELQKENSIKDKDFIAIGERLKVVIASAPVQAKSPVKASVNTNKYVVVKSGDMVGALAKANGSSIKQIKLWNNLDKDYTIYIGQKIRVK